MVAVPPEAAIVLTIDRLSPSGDSSSAMKLSPLPRLLLPLNEYVTSTAGVPHASVNSGLFHCPDPLNILRVRTGGCTVVVTVVVGPGAVLVTIGPGPVTITSAPGIVLARSRVRVVPQAAVERAARAATQPRIIFHIFITLRLHGFTDS